MKRTPEPELMNEPAQAHAYAYADFATPHQLFIDKFKEKFPDLVVNDTVLDLGCGPCDISRRFALAYPESTIHAVDGAENMLAHADTLNRAQHLQERIKLIHGVLPKIELPQKNYETIISNSLLHHLHNPFVLWETIQQHSKPFANIFIMDLMRPETKTEAAALVSEYAGNEAEVLQHDFYHSLLAAFTVDEIRQQLEDMHMSQLSIDVISDRHLIIYGSLS